LHALLVGSETPVVILCLNPHDDFIVLEMTGTSSPTRTGRIVVRIQGPVLTGEKAIDPPVALQRGTLRLQSNSLNMPLLLVDLQEVPVTQIHQHRDPQEDYGTQIFHLD